MNVYWPDAQVESVRIDYDQVKIEVSQGDSAFEVIANGPIGVQWSGLWDETIVQEASVTSDHEFARQSWALAAKRGADTSDSGSPARNRRSWQTLDVTFIDGSHLLIAAAEFV